MRRLSILISLLLVCALPSQAQQVGNYFLNSGDTISIRVLGEEDLSFDTKIGLEGVLQYPFLGKIEVRNRTTNELRDTITAGLKGDYLDNPDVDVSIIEYRPFFILGEVVKPQAYAFQPGLTVAQAVALAGGFTERANKDTIQLKRILNGMSQIYSDVDFDVPVRPDDTITVSQTFF